MKKDLNEKDGVEEVVEDLMCWTAAIRKTWQRRSQRNAVPEGSNRGFQIFVKVDYSKAFMTYVTLSDQVMRKVSEKKTCVSTGTACT